MEQLNSAEWELLIKRLSGFDSQQLKVVSALVEYVKSQQGRAWPAYRLATRRVLKVSN